MRLLQCDRNDRIVVCAQGSGCTCARRFYSWVAEALDRVQGKLGMNAGGCSYSERISLRSLHSVEMTNSGFPLSRE